MAKTEFRQITSFVRLREIMTDKGVTKLYVKKLSPNDNSKNQVYLGPGFEALNIIPNHGITVDDGRNGSKRDRFKADISLGWVDAEGKLYEAPAAQLILYPKYPEVRMSGFLKGCALAPSDLMRLRLEGRLLFLGIRNDGRIIGHATGPDNPLRKEIERLENLEPVGVFFRIPVEKADEGDTRERLIETLREIHQDGWIDSMRLVPGGSVVPCKSSNCGGYTLEAKLGIAPNGFSDPDYLGWEIKQHGVASFDRPHSGSPITLMTPEPTGGIYKDKGIIHFIKTFGYPDKAGRADRLNFGGIYRNGILTASTGLVLQLPGFDIENGKITDASGGISLVGPGGEEAAIWHFADIMKHWNRKHAKAAYIPSLRNMTPHRQYRYGNIVELGTGTDFLHFLSAVARGIVYYDPGIKMENVSGKNPRTKRRSQFRIKPADLACLYDRMEAVDVIKEQ